MFFNEKASLIQRRFSTDLTPSILVFKSRSGSFLSNKQKFSFIKTKYLEVISIGLWRLKKLAEGRHVE